MKCQGGREEERGKRESRWWQGSASKKPLLKPVRAGTPALPTRLPPFHPRRRISRLPHPPQTDCEKGGVQGGALVCLLQLLAPQARRVKFWATFQDGARLALCEPGVRDHFELEVTFGSEVEDERIPTSPTIPI
jgi:hypothetical protein